mgnify:CR=1 FL=1
MGKSIEPLKLTLTHEDSGETKEVLIPVSEQLKAWKEKNPGPLTVEDLRTYLNELFSQPKPSRSLLPPRILHYVREDGVEMIRFDGPDIWGGAMPLSEWNEMLYKQMGSFVTQSSNFVKNKTE